MQEDQEGPHPAPRRRGVVAVVLRGPHLLVIRRSRYVVAPLHFCFPGGGMEGGESEEEALERELREELGCAAKPLRRVWQSVTPWQVELNWWRADVVEPLVPNPAEVDSFHWLTAEQLLQQSPLLESNRQFLEAWRRGAVVL